MADERHVIALDALDTLVATLGQRGYEVVGPQVRDGVIVYDQLGSASDLPTGWGDEHEGGRYRLVRRDDEARFGYAVGPHSWKRYLLPPRSLVFEGSRDGDTLDLRSPQPPPSPLAFLGVRPCDLAAIAVQDRVFLRDTMRDSLYAARREDIFVVAVQCTVPAATCFCASMGTGPGADGGYDLALTELCGDNHRFLVQVGSDAGADVLASMPSQPAEPADVEAAEELLSAAAGQMGRQLDTDGLKDALYANLEHPRWQEVAQRCLGCANCTMVCPTCFCTSLVDTTDVTGAQATRERVWDSCFSVDFSYIHGGSVRTSVAARYRQWLTHKLATWVDQFGTSGCVGCGRCITWCPVGIDITEEAAAIRAGEDTTGGER